MKKNYLYYIGIGFKSKRFWFTFLIIIISSISTSIFNFSNDGGTQIINIGAAEFFIYSTLIGNTLLQISAPIIPIFLSLLMIEESTDATSSYMSNNIITRILAAFTVSSSIFITAFLSIAIYGFIFYPMSSGEIQLIGIAKNIYNMKPVLIVPYTIIHSCFFACAYSLFGIGIALNSKHKTSLAMSIPLVYYFCYQFLSYFVPEKFIKIFIWSVPILSFEVEGFGVPLIKNSIEIILISISGIILTFIAFYRFKKKQIVKSKNSLTD